MKRLLFANKSLMLVVIAGGMLGGTIGWLFYDSIIASSLLAATVACFSPTWWKSKRRRKEREELLYQFQQAVTAMSSSLASGRSIEQAIKQCIGDLRMMYPSEDARMISELKRVEARMSYGEPVDKCLYELAERTDLEEIRQFVEVLTVCKRTGGNMREVMRKTGDVLRDKIEVNRDLVILVASKRWEAKALAAAPIVFLLFLKWSSPEYMLPLYETMKGRMLMSGALLLFFGCFLALARIVNIKL